MNEPGEALHIDVIIAMDATGSMGAWITAARDTVMEAFSTLRMQYENAQFRLGVVCYRDYGEKERFLLQPLSDEIDAVENFLRGVVATGGRDTCEDVAGGLEKVLELFGAPHPTGEIPTRILLFVADAPAHGLRYHAPTVSDRYPKGDPEGKEPYEQAQVLCRMGVDMTLFRITKEMDKMVEEFASAFSDGGDGSFVMLDVVSQGVENINMPVPIPWAAYPAEPSCADHLRTATYSSVSCSLEKRREKK